VGKITDSAGRMDETSSVSGAWPGGRTRC
jgi:hypothetical protein